MSDTTIQAKVTLTSLTVGIFPSTRILYLHEYNETIPIGRSSKNPLKHLVAAADNCWVDSDVVSRDHAQLKFDADVETIFIEDTMSMHGTRINNKQIPKNDPIPLANNDVVSLGAEVKRGIEVYPECRFRVNFELLPYIPSTGRTYQLLSDDEDEDDSFEISDDECYDIGPVEISDDDEEIPRKDSVSTSTSESKANEMTGGLDATLDDDVVEIDPTAYKASTLPTKAESSFQAAVESVNEPVDISDSDDESIASSDCEPSERPIGRGTSVDITFESAHLRASIEADDYNQEGSGNSGDEDLDAVSVADSWLESDHSDDGNEESEDIGGFLDDAIVAAYEVPSSSFDKCELPRYDPPTEDHPQWPKAKSTTQLPQFNGAMAPTAQAPLAPMFSPVASVEPATLKPLDLEIDLPQTRAQPLSMPSPSDAALKGGRVTTPPWRTEKQEFLAARVDNRARARPHWMDVGPMENAATNGELAAASGSFGGVVSQSNGYNQQKKPDFDSNGIVSEGIVSLREKPSVQAMLLESPREPPLKRKRDEMTIDEPVRVTTVPETMQSTVSARNIKAISDARAMRRAQAETAVSAYNNATRTTDLAVATLPNVLTKVTNLAPAAKSTAVLASAPTTSTTPATAIDLTQQDQEPPAKRQKQDETKAAKRLAFATFGGFMAGAGLFVVLVATAPNFGAVV
ncbi:hypothetical protein V490_07632 [Pseudogymnoascus sp. VKM F-3557]|nr:hypothetical protein V490_07632 [Pseudogymnoascus sp. VKM F-3557]